VLWGSLPCTGGSTWNYINGRTPEGKAKIDERIKKMVVLLQRFSVVAKIVLKWPSKCTYWKRNDVMQMIETLAIKPAFFCGCALGLMSLTKGNEHMFIKKPWRVCSNSCKVVQAFSKYSCPGTSDTHVHDQCRGVNAKNSERYTDMFADCFHKSVRAEFSSRRS
jgi:hypothetical protein